MKNTQITTLTVETNEIEKQQTIQKPIHKHVHKQSQKHTKNKFYKKIQKINSKRSITTEIFFTEHDIQSKEELIPYSNIFVVLIFNNYYVRWEEFTISSTLQDLHELLTNKYKVGTYTIEIETMWLNIEHCNDPIIDFCKKNTNNVTITVFTNDENYTLDKSIM